MGVLDQAITDTYALYNGDCMEVMPTFPDGSIHLSVYSPPFAGIYQYTSSERDLSNCRDYDEFFTQYEFIVQELHRLTVPGRMTAVHCMDVPMSNTGRGDGLWDFPGDIIRLHKRLGFDYVARYHVWKEPLTVRNRTMTKALAHKTIVDDSSRCQAAGADYLLLFRKRGENPVPIAHPNGLTEYAGGRRMPADVLRYRGWKGKQTENRYSHWIWRQYASAFWDDVRLDRVLPFQEARDEEDEKHIHPLQLDVIDRCLVLWSNLGERVLTPFMGVGSEVCAAVRAGRIGIGVELKPSYYAQAVRNLDAIEAASDQQEFAWAAGEPPVTRPVRPYEQPPLPQVMEYAEGIPFMAGLYLGLCPSCGARLNTTYSIVRRGAFLYHAGPCDPDRRCVLCGVESPAGGPLCADHFNAWCAALSLIAAMRSPFPPPVDEARARRYFRRDGVVPNAVPEWIQARRELREARRGR